MRFIFNHFQPLLRLWNDVIWDFVWRSEIFKCLFFFFFDNLSSSIFLERKKFKKENEYFHSNDLSPSPKISIIQGGGYRNTGRDKIVRFHGSVWYETRASILVDNCFIIAVSGEGIITRVAPQLTETTDMQERSQRVVIFAGITASPPQPSFVNLLGSL